MSCKDKHFNGNCVCDVVRFINDLQDAVIEDDNRCPESCLRPVLGATNGPCNKPNTRPFILYTKDGSPFEAYFNSGSGSNCTSRIFRVESVDGCCAVLRVLQIEPGADTPNAICQYLAGEGNRRLVATSQCVVVDLDCFCAIQCLEDVFIDL